MPQMAPIWWSTLFMMFIISFILVMVLMYFFNIYSFKQKNIKKMSSTKMLNWKW